MNESENKIDWLDELTDEITELLADPKQVRFNTHKNRKLFTGKLVGIIKDAIHKNTLPKNEDKPTRANTPTITRPNPSKEAKGFSVMTEQLSQMGDESLKDTVARKKAGVRTW